MGRPKKNKNYFDVVEERAVILYIYDYIPEENIAILTKEYGDLPRPTSSEERNVIFEKFLYLPLEKLVNSIVKRYQKHVGRFGLDELIQSSFVHVFENMHKFKPYREGEIRKAYSYYGAVCKHYMMKKCKDGYKSDTHSVDFDEIVGEIEKDLKYSYEIIEENDNKFEKLLSKLIDSIRLELDNNRNLRINEIKVGEALIIIFKEWKNICDEIEENKISNYFAKKKLQEMLIEITSLQHKDIRASLKVFKTLYFLEKQLDIVE